MEFDITDAEAGERLDRVLAARVPQVSRMWLRRMLDEGQVWVGGEPRAAGRRVMAGERVRLDLPTKATSMTPEAIPITVLYEDGDVLVVEKPADMVVHPAGRHRSGTL